jgi:hypothetical protein
MREPFICDAEACLEPFGYAQDKPDEGLCGESGRPGAMRCAPGKSCLWYWR